jgi:hypothetical protein
MLIERWKLSWWLVKAAKLVNGSSWNLPNEITGTASAGDDDDIFLPSRPFLKMPRIHLAETRWI